MGEWAMNSPKTNAKSSGFQQLSAGKRARGAKSTQQEEFSSIVGSIAKRYGVKVASVAAPVTNPYAMSVKQSAKVALKAGIITSTGNLKATFK
jgi:hypothetical protein